MSGTLYFFIAPIGGARNRAALWKSDGTEAGTVLVKDFDTFLVSDAVVAGGQFFYSATPPSGGLFQLWRSDGTTSGTRVIRQDDLEIGRMTNLTPRIGDVEGVLLLSAATGAGGFELWRSDGTDEGTFLVQEIAAGDNSSDPRGFVTARHRVYFTADDHVHGEELWGGRAAIVTRQPRRSIQDLSEEVHDLFLADGTSRSLQAKLAAALSAFDRGSPVAATGLLKAFSNEVAAQRGGRIPRVEADGLVEFVGEVVELLEEQ